ncbi:PP2C family protein-serine/threonine phosphatase [Streptomyces mirabilis]|nr:PP2C family protein-serine/threonine phosphatase [Streptomyces mirabilis]
MVTPDGTAEFVDLPVGPPLGVGGLPFEAVEWEVPRGSLLALYTDGLVEVPEHDLGKGMALLRRCLERPAHSLEALCDDLVQTLLPAQPSDDVALLVARTRTPRLGPGRHLGPACRPGRRGGRARRGLPSPGEVGTAGGLLHRGIGGERAGHQRDPLRRPSPSATPDPGHRADLRGLRRQQYRPAHAPGPHLR